MNDAQKAGRRQFLLLAALFAAPIVAAVTMFAWPELQPRGRTNYGELVMPVRRMHALQFLAANGAAADAAIFKGKWSLVYLGGPECGKTCQDKLYQVRQVRTLLNEKRVRVQRIYIAPGAASLQAARTILAPAHPDLIYLAQEAQSATRFFEPRGLDAIYLLDPLGNWMMRYPDDAEYKGMLKDIKYLLKLSHIG